ncbi:MarR family winged helix-turn-helix transcriptional regulator [Paenibacillus gorillae]|uniref:MarR family winged helix-turn-helix transcriptional regulator n=1 Tax=Paenibacillus gorillae TaxID=1243662 RepID=UPI0004AD8564|nr:MarR family transcriptional regulator [Paenibacillus gorillae]
MRQQGLDHSLGFVMGISYRRMNQLFMTRIKSFDLTPEQWSVLYRIREQDGMIQKDIAEKSGKDKPTTTRILDSLEAKGYVTKKIGKNDRRSYHVHITEAGIQAADEIAPIEYQVLRDVSGVLTDEEYALMISMLNKLSIQAASLLEQEKE